MVIRLNTQAAAVIIVATVMVLGTIGFLGARYITMVGVVQVETIINNSAVRVYNERLSTLNDKYNKFQPAIVPPEKP